MARPSNTLERRAEIVAALAATMATEGYERATIALVAERAGLAPGLVHYHFESKQQILLALLEHLASATSARVESAVAAGASPRAQLLLAVDALLGLGRSADAEAMACWVAIAAEAVRDATVRARYAEAVTNTARGLAQLAHAALSKGPGRRARASSIAAAIVAASQGYFTLASAAPGVIPPGSAAPAVRAMVVALLDSPSTPETGASS